MRFRSGGVRTLVVLRCDSDGTEPVASSGAAMELAIIDARNGIRIGGVNMVGSLGEALQTLRDASGLMMASVVGADGLMIDSAHAPDVDAESFSAFAASGLLMMDALGQELGEGSARQAILEYGSSVVMLTPLQEELLLVTVAKGEANLGRMRLTVRRFVDQVSSALATV